MLIVMLTIGAVLFLVTVLILIGDRMMNPIVAVRRESVRATHMARNYA